MVQILHVSPFFGDTMIGGTERFVNNLVREQIKLDNQIKIMTTSKFPRTEIFLDKIEVKKNRTIAIIKNFNPISLVNPFSRYFRWAEIVHIHSPLYILSFITILISYLLRKKIVLHIHGGLGIPPSIVKSYLAIIKPVFDLTIVKLQCKMSSIIFAVSYVDKQYLINELKINPKKIILINNGINTSVFTPKSNKVNGKIDKFNILYFGDLEPWKGVEDLLYAIHGFKSSYPIKLNIIGDGSDKIKLEKLGRRLNINIEFYGNIHHSELPEKIKENHIFVHTGHWEGMPTTILESAACNIPIIATSVGHTKYFIKHGHSGLLYKAGDLEDLSYQIRWGIEHYDKFVEYSTRANEKTINDYDLSVISEKIQIEYQRLYNKD